VQFFILKKRASILFYNNLGNINANTKDTYNLGALENTDKMKDNIVRIIYVVLNRFDGHCVLIEIVHRKLLQRAFLIIDAVHSLNLINSTI
jgi:hypothetical protein